MAAVQCHLSCLSIVKCWLECCSDKDRAASCIVSVPVWKGHSSLWPAASIKAETTIVKAAEFFQSATCFFYGGVHVFCPTKMAAADMSWGARRNKKLVWFLFFLLHGIVCFMPPDGDFLLWMRVMRGKFNSTWAPSNLSKWKMYITRKGEGLKGKVFTKPREIWDSSTTWDLGPDLVNKLNICLMLIVSWVFFFSG